MADETELRYDVPGLGTVVFKNECKEIEEFLMWLNPKNYRLYPGLLVNGRLAELNFYLWPEPNIALPRRQESVSYSPKGGYETVATIDDDVEYAGESYEAFMAEEEAQLDPRIRHGMKILLDSLVHFERFTADGHISCKARLDSLPIEFYIRVDCDWYLYDSLLRKLADRETMLSVFQQSLSSLATMQ